MRNQAAEPVMVWLLIAAIVAACYWRRKWHGSGTSHGTAAWTTPSQLRRAGHALRPGTNHRLPRAEG